MNVVGERETKKGKITRENKVGLGARDRWRN